MYEISRDIKKLRSRIERLEEACRGSCDYSEAERPSEWSGRISVDQKMGVDFDQEPVVWKLQEEAKFPPFLFHLFNPLPNAQFYILPESKTWTCTPEPLIVDVYWDTGSREEHFRLSDQVFSIIRVTDPNTGIVKATAIYSARLTQRNGRSVDYAGSYAGPSFHVTLRSAGGAVLFSYYARFSVLCGANSTFNFSENFPPGLYDLVTGATWEMSKWSVNRC